MRKTNLYGVTVIRIPMHHIRKPCVAHPCPSSPSRNSTAHFVITSVHRLYSIRESYRSFSFLLGSSHCLPLEISTILTRPFSLNLGRNLAWGASSSISTISARSSTSRVRSSAVGRRARRSYRQKGSNRGCPTQNPE